MKYLIITVLLINFNTFAKKVVVKEHCIEVPVKSKSQFFETIDENFCEYKIDELRECFIRLYKKAFNIDCKMFDKIKEKSK